MKILQQYITEKFKISSNSVQRYKPESRKELRDIIIKILDEEGPDAYLNNIDTSLITDMNHLFSRIASKVGDIDISDWDVSNVEDMAFMFADCKKFNCDLRNWNTEKVKDMSNMFYNCEEFNQNLEDWDVSNVESFEEMFYNCKKFDCDLRKWNVSKGNNFNRMFYNCENFKGKGIENWQPKGWRMTDIFKNTKIRKNDMPSWVPF